MSAVRTLSSQPSTSRRQWESVVHVLAAPMFAHKTAQFLDPATTSADIEGLVGAAEVWSHGEQLMVALAADLWDGREVSVRALCTTLDDCNFARALEALRVARGCRESFASSGGVA